MPKKTIREMSALERMHYSLGARLFHAVLIITIIISIVAIAFGFYLYGNAVRREYRTQAWHTAKTAEALIDKNIATEKLTEIIKLYLRNADSIENEEAYLDVFAETKDADFESIRDTLHSIEVENDAYAVYLGLLDIKRNRLVYLIDSNEAEDFYEPGTIEEIPESELNAYLNGAPINSIDALLGDTEPMPTAITNTDKNGYLCTAADELFSNDEIAVMAFADLSMEHVTRTSMRFLAQYFLLLLFVGIVVAFIMVKHLEKNVVKPINELADAAQAYSRDKHNAESTGKHFEKLNIKTGDEIENLAWIMKDMENDLADYVQNLTKVTAEKEKMNTELNVASQIQEGMLPHIYPAFPDRPEFEVYATMNPAKEVGGDFYDFFLIDDDHLGVVMADVSGKGIPAALFMMASKILIGNISKMANLSPASILSVVNDQICSNNTAEMFVTVWLGILELSTGKLTAANAGHEFPVVRSGDNKQFELLKDKHGFVVGGMEGTKYTDYEIQLYPGDAIFQYTDGVTEATNKDSELFGTDRLVDALNENSGAGVYEILPNVANAIDEFVKDAPQFDDITMMCLEYKGPKGE